MAACGWPARPKTSGSATSSAAPSRTRRSRLLGTPETCGIQPACVLSGILAKALAAFMAVLDSHTLADLVAEPDSLLVLLDARAVGPTVQARRPRRRQ